jgi:hypothetical protein
MLSAEIPQVESDPVVYRLWKYGSYGSQYFLLENRQRVGFDVPLRGEGLLIYHVDETQWGNWDVNHYHVALEQADGDFDLEWSSSEGDNGDPYPGSDSVRSFDDLSTPSSRAYDGSTTEVSVWNISNPDSVMTANLDIEWSRPYYLLDSIVFDDADADGIMEPLETVQCYFYVTNLWKTGTSITATLSSNDYEITYTIPTVAVSDIIGDGGTGSNIGSPFEFTLPDFPYPIFDSFYVTIETYGGEHIITFGVEKIIGQTEILVVDDDRGENYENRYMEDLRAKMAPADLWEKHTQGSPSGSDLNEYNTVFWFTGDTSSNLLTAGDITAIKSFLDNGGSLFLTGQGLADELHTDDSAFLENYLHARNDNLYFQYQHLGAEGSVIGDGLSCRYHSSSNQEFTQSRMIEVVAPAITEFNFYGGGPSALSYSGDYKLVFFNWGYEAISDDFAEYDHRDTIMANILYFLTNWQPPVCIDTDGDGYGDPGNPQNRCVTDNCPNIPNTSQDDLDNDNVGDACDNCLSKPNTSQTDDDSDGVGDLCDNCPNTDNSNQTNSDSDPFGDACDNCPSDYNPSQSDSDGDDAGDLCDNCPAVNNPAQTDSDADNIGDLCDNCPNDSNPGQEDSNGNGIGDACDMICGDVNADSSINIKDITYLIKYKYKGGEEPIPWESGDVNSDGSINIKDITYLIKYKYKGGPEPYCL